VKEVFEVRIHGRAGQGAKSGGQILALAAFKEGKTIHAFPEYGSERRGAPTVAYTRISEKEIRSHEPIVNPDVVIVLDDTLLYTIPVTKGLSDEGVLIVNTVKSPEEVRRITKFKGKIFTVDASGISINNIGRDAPNVPSLGVLVKSYPLVKLESLELAIREIFEKKIGKEKVEANIKALREGYKEAKS